MATERWRRVNGERETERKKESERMRKPKERDRPSIKKSDVAVAVSASVLRG